MVLVHESFSLLQDITLESNRASLVIRRYDTQSYSPIAMNCDRSLERAVPYWAICSACFKVHMPSKGFPLKNSRFTPARPCLQPASNTVHRNAYISQPEVPTGAFGISALRQSAVKLGSNVHHSTSYYRAAVQSRISARRFSPSNPTTYLQWMQDTSVYHHGPWLPSTAWSSWSCSPSIKAACAFAMI